MHGEVNVALAMAVENAVVTAVIKNADKLALGDIAKARKELTERLSAGNQFARRPSVRENPGFPDRYRAGWQSNRGTE